jgi:LysM repeat protein
LKDGMFGINSVILGAIAAGLSIVIVLGSVLLALTEVAQTTSITSVPTLESVDIATPLTPATPVPTIPPTSTPTKTSPPTLTPTMAITATEQEAQCDLPIGWEPYTINPGDTLNKLAESAGLSAQELADANCLQESRLTPDTILYLPPASPTHPPVTCGPPSNWVVYYVQPGDTLFSIAQRVNSTVSQLKYANCLNSDNIRTGQKLFVPYQPAPNPSPTEPPPSQPPPSPTSTQEFTATPTEGNILKPQPTDPYPPP